MRFGSREKSRHSRTKIGRCGSVCPSDRLHAQSPSSPRLGRKVLLSDPCHRGGSRTSLRGVSVSYLITRAAQCDATQSYITTLRRRAVANSAPALLEKPET